MKKYRFFQLFSVLLTSVIDSQSTGRFFQTLTKHLPSQNTLTTALERFHKLSIRWAGMPRMSKLAPSQCCKRSQDCHNNCLISRVFLSKPVLFYTIMWLICKAILLWQCCRFFVFSKLLIAVSKGLSGEMQDIDTKNKIITLAKMLWQHFYFSRKSMFFFKAITL